MKVIIPHDIDVESTNIAANSEAEWVTGTTYGLGDLVQETDVFPNMVYRSLRSNNTGRYPPTNLEPVQETATSTTSVAIETGTKTWTVQTGKTFAPGMMVTVARSTTPNTYKATGEVTAYTTGTGALEVNVTSVTGSGTYNAWTVTSVDEIGFWEEVSATDQHLMFDQYVNTKSVNTDSIEIELNTANADMVALFGLSGIEVDLSLWDSTDTTEYWSDTISLIYGNEFEGAIADWYEYFFGEYAAKEDVIVEIPVNVYEGILKITITADTGVDAECGHLVVGRGFYLGASQYGASVGIKDYSRKETDDSGRTTIEQGYWAKVNDITLYVQNTMINSVYRKLVGLRGTPTAWIGNNESTSYEGLLVFGFYQNFDVTVAGPRHSWCNLQIEGLT